MKRYVYLIGACYTLYSCKAPSYSYVPATMNTTAYSHGGEGQLGLVFGSPGFAGKGGIAVTRNINVNAWAATLPSDSGYSSKESEYSIGVQTNENKNREVTSFWVGLGNGSNKKVRTDLSGHFNRLFLQIQQSVINNPLGNARFDGFFGIRVNYLDYTGTRQDKPLNDILYYYEPYLGFNVGSKNVRFEFLTGLAIKNTGEWSHGVQVWPWFGHIGVIGKLGKIQ
ncbi:hypothetical protein A3860_30625 [Niastella vici]|uniref:Uncharacterized protein n=1 Tax=Niastella vici TaxID=1703345 RepID=A0A1V9FU05_9BACT|nr:hypothetical protein [Niastella vici]OQP61823.1 hypothetical protein A3860_30625 [Niastella vici]